MKYLKLFEDHSDDIINSVPPEFWKMVKIADWSSVMEYRKNNGNYYNEEFRDFYKKAQSRIYVKYDYSKIKEFSVYYENNIYYLLYDEFYPIAEKCDVSDDGYCDLISSVIGKGKKFVKECIKNPNLVIKMGKNGDYVENFGYLLSVSEDDYLDILNEFYPNDIRVMAKKYNV